MNTLKSLLFMPSVKCFTTHGSFIPIALSVGSSERVLILAISLTSFKAAFLIGIVLLIIFYIFQTLLINSHFLHFKTSYFFLFIKWVKSWVQLSRLDLNLPPRGVNCISFKFAL